MFSGNRSNIVHNFMLNSVLFDETDIISSHIIERVIGMSDERKRTNSALLVIDYINELVHPKGKLSSPFVDFIATHNTFFQVNRALQYARDHNILIIVVKVGFSPSYDECPSGSPLLSNAKTFNAFKLGEWGTEFIQDINVLAEDDIVIKHRINAFYATDLETLLRANKIEEIMIAGISTDMAVESTARDAHDRDYGVYILEDACAAHNDQTHHASLENLKKIAQVIRVDEWINKA